MLGYLGFEYSQTKRKDGIIHWRCRYYKGPPVCYSKMTTSDDNHAIIKAPSDHSHQSYPQKILANAAIQTMKRQIIGGANPRNIIGSVLNQLEVSKEVQVHMPKRSSISRMLNRARRAERDTFNPDPDTAQFDIPGHFLDIILHDTGAFDPSRILAIGDRDLLAELQKDKIFGDGTFDKAPKVFYQIYTWHAKIGNSYPPCIYFLLQNKSQETYNRMFAILCNLLPNWAPQTVVVDFEKACISAAQNNYPNVQVKCCYFHLSQSLLRKIHSVGLKTVFDDQSDAALPMRMKLKSLAALAFVPQGDVRALFEVLISRFPNERKYNDLTAYFSSTYITNHSGLDALFPIRLWNHYEAALSGEERTTNCCEGYHNSLRALFNCSHPSMWDLMDGLKKDIALHGKTLVDARNGNPEPTRRKYQKLQRQVMAHVAEYQIAEDKIDYLAKIANLQ